MFKNILFLQNCGVKVPKPFKKCLLKKVQKKENTITIVAMAIAIQIQEKIQNFVLPLFLKYRWMLTEPSVGPS